MKGGVPREIVDSGGDFEKDDGRALGSGNIFGNTTRHLPNLEVVEMPRKAALNTLGVKLRKAFFHRWEFYSIPLVLFRIKKADCCIRPFVLPIGILFVAQSLQQIRADFLEKGFIFFAEVIYPTARLPRAEGVTLFRVDRLDEN